MVLGATLLAFAPGLAGGQPREVVAWTVAAPAASPVKAGSRIAITLRGAVQDGWHVYALQQLPEGPTPLRVALAPGAIATADGAPTGSRPEKVLDPAFKLETQYYARPFSLTVPVRVAANAAGGAQAIPLTVRYQTCNGDICHPPKTVKLSAPINVLAD